MFFIRRIGVCCLLVLAAVVGRLWAAQPDPVSLTFQATDGTYRFDGGFQVEADPDVVWAVLTDFDHYSNFIANTHAQVLENHGAELLVRETVGGGFLFITESISSRLAVFEIPQQTVFFQDIKRRNFAFYQGVWSIHPGTTGDGIVVTYSLEAQRSKDTPGFLTDDLFKQSTHDLLFQMWKEMVKRQAKKVREAALATPLATPAFTPAPLPPAPHPVGGKP